MNRRRFLTALGGGSSIGGLWYVLRPPRRTIRIRFWLSAAASSYEGIEPRIASYLETAFAPVYDEVDVSYGGVVPVRNEHGFEVMASGEWPRRVAAGYAGSRGLNPVSDVNLLVTDGPMSRTPSGSGLPHLASVGGARYLTSVPPRDDVDDVVPYSAHARVMQVLIHEVGHALGLAHEHGTITNADDATVASPMVSSYAWLDDSRADEQFDAEYSACGSRYPIDRDGARHLSYVFSGCAVSKLRKYRGGFHPRWE